jgi:hypothetical protein
MRLHLLAIEKGPDLEKAAQDLVQALGRDKDAALDAKVVQVVAKNLAVVVALMGPGAVQDRVDLGWVGRLLDQASVDQASVDQASVVPARVLTVSVLRISGPERAGPDILRRHRNRWLRKPWSSTVIPTVNWIAKSS